MSVVFAAVASLTLIFIVLVLLRNLRDPAFWAYFLTGLFWILILTGILFTLRWQIFSLGAFLAALGVTFLPSGATFFSFCFARENLSELLRRWKWFLGLMFLFSLVFLIFALQGQLYVVGAGPDEEKLLLAFTNPGRLFLAFLFLTTLISLVNLESTYRLSKGKERSRLKLPLTLLVSTYAWQIYAITSSFVLGFLNYWVLQIGFLMILATLISTGTYLLRQSTSLPAIYMGRRLAYSSAAFVLVGLYLVFIGLVASFIPKLGGNLQVFISVLAALMVLIVLVILAFWETWRQRLEKLLERLLYPGRFDFREEWKKFSENISALLDAQEIQKEVIKVVGQNLGVEHLAILARTSRNSGLSLTHLTEKDFGGQMALPQDDPFWGWLLRYGESVEKRQVEKLLESYHSGSRIKELFNQTGATVITPLIANRELEGMLILPAKQNGETYTNEDFDLLNAISGQAALALLNARAGQELILSREMESFHKFSAFVIHDLKNSISMLSMLLANAQGNLNNPQFQSSALETIDQAVRKMKTLVDKLSSPPEGSTLVLRQTDLNQLLQRSARELKLELMPNLKLEWQLGQLPSVNCDPAQMEKVIQNLLLNAMEAMPKGGRIMVATELVVPPGQAQEVRISLSDNGVGLSPEYLHTRLFQPFSSTKKSGLGIGLFQSKEIVEQHGGRIWVESAQGKGTTFHISLPLEPAPVEAS